MRILLPDMLQIDPVWNQKYDSKPVGSVPDFDRLHNEFDLHMTRVKATTRRNLTVPHEFKLNGATPEEEVRPRARGRSVLVSREMGIAQVGVPRTFGVGTIVWKHCYKAVSNLLAILLLLLTCLI